MPSPSLSRQFHDLEIRTEALEGRIGNFEDGLCPTCKSWLPSTMSARELKSIRLKRTARFQELMTLWDQAKAQGMTHKIWRTVGGSAVRGSHMAANNQKVKIDDNFKIGNESLFLPADPSAPLDETANCRCGVNYVKEGDASSTEKNENPSRTEVEDELKKVSTKYDIPLRALLALISTESDFRQYGPDGLPLINSNPKSSAAGLGQVTRTTADLYNEDYSRLLEDWKYNLDVAGKVFAYGYFHPWNKGTDLRVRAARAYGIYHDGIQPDMDPERYNEQPRGLVGTPWERRYLPRYDALQP